jgi:hypothetical protein
MNNRQLLMTGVIAGAGVILVFAVLFSTLQNAASAQMMQHQGMGAMGPGMMPASSTSQSYGGTFSSSASSAVSNVKVTGVSITGAGKVTVSLRYTGTGASPGVVLVANTDPTTMMSMMHGTSASSGMMGMGGMQGMGMMGSGMTGAMPMASSSYPAWTNAQWQQWHTQMAGQLAMTNSTQWQDWHSQMMMNPAWNSTSTMPHASALQIGSTAVDAGWKNGTFKVKLQGDGSAYDSEHIMAMVFPLTS